MRLRVVSLCVFLSCIPAFGADVVGIQVSDMDRKADPCTDFFEYSNGAWRANNPIPASMDRWSRRWQAGENNKEKVRDILEESAAKSGQPRGSVQQLVGDFYAACTDMTAINQLGMKPIAPLMSLISQTIVPAIPMVHTERLRTLSGAAIHVVLHSSILLCCIAAY